MVEGFLQLAAPLFEERELSCRELVEGIAVGTYEVGEHGTGNDGLLMAQTVDEFVGFVDVEPQPVHARVELDVYGPAGDALLAGLPDEGIEQSEGVDLGLQVVVEERLERCHLRVHHHDVGRDARIAQRHSLIGHGHGQVVHTVFLQGLGYLDGPSPVSVGLDHAHELGLWLQQRTVVVQVVHHSVEVYLKDGLVYLLLQQFRDALEAEAAGAFQQDGLVVQGMDYGACEERVGRGKEVFLAHGEGIGRCRNLSTNADKFADAALLAEHVHLSVQLGRVLAALVNVAQDEGVSGCRLLAAAHEVEGDVERMDVVVVGVVDQGATVLTLFHFQSHGDGL